MAINIKNTIFGAIGDGASHPLSERYFTLEAAQEFYPFVTDLGQQIDWAAIQKAVNILHSAGGTIIIPDGKYLLNRHPSSISSGDYYSVLFTSGNISIKGEGGGVTILKQTDWNTNQANDVNLLFFDGRNSVFKNISISDLTFEGHNPANPSIADADTTKCALLVFHGKNNTEYLKQISIQHCFFNNPIRDAIHIAWCQNVRIENCSFNYYDGYVAPTMETEHRVGIFSGAPAILDVTVTGNTFNGNVDCNSINDQGADGFIWFSKGGNISVTGNIIKNYKLEGIQMNAGPATITGNTFDTNIGEGASVALSAWADISNNNPINGIFILSPSYNFTGNTVRGGVYGVLCKGPSYLRYGNIAPRIQMIVDGNFFELRNDIESLVVGAIAAEQLTITNNISKGATRLFHNSVSGPGESFPHLNFLIKNLIITGNTHEVKNNRSSIPIWLQDPLDDNGFVIIDNNKIDCGSSFYHILLAGKNIGYFGYVNIISGDIKNGIIYKVKATKIGGNIKYPKDTGTEYYDGQEFIGNNSLEYNNNGAIVLLRDGPIQNNVVYKFYAPGGGELVYPPRYGQISLSNGTEFVGKDINGSIFMTGGSPSAVKKVMPKIIPNNAKYRVVIGPNNVFFDNISKNKDHPKIGVMYYDYNINSFVIDKSLSSIDGVVIEYKYGRNFSSSVGPTIRTPGYRAGDIIRNTNRGAQGKVLFWEAQEDGYFEPVFGAFRGLVMAKLINATMASIPVEIFAPLAGQSLRIINVEFLLLGSIGWGGSFLTHLRIRRKPTLLTICDLPISKLATKTLQNDILYNNRVLGQPLGANQGLEVIGWDGTKPVNANNGDQVLIAITGILEWA